MPELRAIIQVKTNIPQLMKKIQGDVLRDYTKGLVSIHDKIRVMVLDEVRTAIVSTEPYQAVVNGQLDAELGFYPNEGATRMESILQLWLQSVRVTGPHIDGNGVRLKITAIPSDYDRVLASPEASYRSNPSGSTIEWLKWMLVNADSIAEYSIKHGSFGNSRSGEAYMIHIGANAIGGGWSLQPPEGAGGGTNFIMEAMDNAMPIIVARMEEITKTMLSQIRPSK